MQVKKGGGGSNQRWCIKKKKEAKKGELRDERNPRRTGNVEGKKETYRRHFNEARRTSLNRGIERTEGKDRKHDISGAARTAGKHGTAKSQSKIRSLGSRPSKEGLKRDEFNTLTFDTALQGRAKRRSDL